MESVRVFDSKLAKLIQGGVYNVLLEKQEKEEEDEEIPTLVTVIDNYSVNKYSNLSCSSCKVEFIDQNQHREHYKLDWHRYNLKQCLLSKLKLPITEEEFNDQTDVSSISGSESDEEDTLDAVAIAQGKVFFRNATGQVLGIYRCLFVCKKMEIDNSLVSKCLQEYQTNNQWTVLMLGGGHFAGAVFKGYQPILHKTFHCYTVRAGQGSAQSSRDNQSASSHPKSAGASLRRYNEVSLVQHIKDILEVWRPEIEKSSLIIYRAAGPYNRSVLFSGKTPLLDRQDPRLRTVPFSTRRATFTEVKRIHEVLSTVYVYDSLVSASNYFVKLKASDHESRRNRARTSNVNRAKSRELLERALPAPLDFVENSENNAYNTLVKSKSPKKQHHSKISESESDEEFIITEKTILFEDSILEYGNSLISEEKNQHKKKKQPRKSKTQKLREADDAQRKELYDIAKAGDVGKLQKLLSFNDDNKNIHKLINDKITDDGNSLLHIASAGQQISMVEFLLDNGADVCLKNSKQQTPYTIGQNKEVRDFFKKFAIDNPDKFNYNKANIPTSNVCPEDMAEKKRLQRKAKRQKEKEKKKENEIKKQEDIEKDRFLQLSDREKRALAAERRILTQNGVIVSRCFLCASDMAGKVPFEYAGNRFCSMECLKAHRMRNPVILSG